MHRDLTDAQASALEWLRERGGNGIIDKRGRLVAAGETAILVEAATWLRLVAAGAIIGAGKRLRIAPKPHENIS